MTPFPPRVRTQAAAIPERQRVNNVIWLKVQVRLRKATAHLDAVVSMAFEDLPVKMWLALPLSRRANHMVNE